MPILLPKNTATNGTETYFLPLDVPMRQVTKFPKSFPTGRAAGASIEDLIASFVWLCLLCRTWPAPNPVFHAVLQAPTPHHLPRKRPWNSVSWPERGKSGCCFVGVAGTGFKSFCSRTFCQKSRRGLLLHACPSFPPDPHPRARRGRNGGWDRGSGWVSFSLSIATAKSEKSWRRSTNCSRGGMGPRGSPFLYSRSCRDGTNNAQPGAPAGRLAWDRRGTQRGGGVGQWWPAGPEAQSAHSPEERGAAGGTASPSGVAAAGQEFGRVFISPGVWKEEVRNARNASWYEMNAAEEGNCCPTQWLGRGWGGDYWGLAREGSRRSWAAPRPRVVCDRSGGNAGNSRKRGPAEEGCPAQGGSEGRKETSSGWKGEQGKGAGAAGALGTPLPLESDAVVRAGVASERGESWSSRPGRAGLNRRKSSGNAATCFGAFPKTGLRRCGDSTATQQPPVPAAGNERWVRASAPGEPGLPQSSLGARPRPSSVAPSDHARPAPLRDVMGFPPSIAEPLQNKPTPTPQKWS